MTGRKIKNLVRKEIRYKRENMSLEEKKNLSTVITEKFFNLPEIEKADVIMSYMDFKNEVETRELNEKLIKLGKKVLIPRVSEDKEKIIPAEITGQYRTGNFGIAESLGKDFAGKKIDIFWGEKSRTEEVPFYSGNLDIFVTGRADLVAETEEGDKYIVDYKTGSRKSEQLDIYSIIMYGDENAALKRIYNVIQGEYEKLNGSKITKADLEQMFKDFADGAEYMRAEKKTACSNCEYINICRREVV